MTGLRKPNADHLLRQNSMTLSGTNLSLLPGSRAKGRPAPAVGLRGLLRRVASAHGSEATPYAAAKLYGAFGGR